MLNDLAWALVLTYTFGTVVCVAFGFILRFLLAATDTERIQGARLIVRGCLWPLDLARGIRPTARGIIEDARKDPR